MKNGFFSLLTLFVGLVILSSCGAKSDPKNVAQEFLNALTRMDYKGAKKYGTAETGKMLDMLESFSSMMPDSIRSKAKDVKVEIKGVKEDGNTCEVTYRTSDKDEDQTLSLVKQENKWLVNMSKEDELNNTETESIEPDSSEVEAAGPVTDSLRVEGEPGKEEESNK